MNDWNGNGKYDSSDSYMDYKLANSGTNSGGGKKSGGSGQWGILIYLIVMVIAAIINEGVGAVMLFGLGWYYVCNGFML